MGNFALALAYTWLFCHQHHQNYDTTEDFDF